jgi:hypothetical protein
MRTTVKKWWGVIDLSLQSGYAIDVYQGEESRTRRHVRNNHFIIGEFSTPEQAKERIHEVLRLNELRQARDGQNAH